MTPETEAFLAKYERLYGDIIVLEVLLEEYKKKAVSAVGATETAKTDHMPYGSTFSLDQKSSNVNTQYAKREVNFDV